MSKGLLNDPAWYQALTLAERLELRRSASGAAVSRGPEPEAAINGCLRLGHQRLLTPQDFEEAETVCGELGLGELLKRMPAGLLQLVGETGWQLSHGERSRLFIARALLQEADLVILAPRRVLGPLRLPISPPGRVWCDDASVTRTRPAVSEVKTWNSSKS